MWRFSRLAQPVSKSVLDLKFRTIDIRGDGEGEGKDPRARLLGSFLLITKNLSKLEKIIVNNTEI